MASFRAHLSPNEELTLWRIAANTANPADLPEANIKRLVALGLVQEIDGELTATPHGLERCPRHITAPLRPMVRSRLKVRKLPF
jgi:hypothetical protein